MSDRFVAGIVCEGPSDIPVLREIILTIWPEIDDVRVLQPEVDEIGRMRAGATAGWCGVRSWCEQHAGRLSEVTDPDVGERFDLLVVALDVDIAIDAGIANPPASVGAYATKRLCDVVKGWLRTNARSALPPELVIAIPAMAIEAWVIAALFPRDNGPERARNPAEALVRKGKLRRSPRDGKPWKAARSYEDFARRVAGRLSAVRRGCSEAERMCRKIETLRALALSHRNRGALR